MRRLSGLTLVELMVALAISAMVAAAALRAATTVARVEAIERRSAALNTTNEPLRRLLEADLAHARRYRTTKDQLVLASWLMLNEQTLTVEHLPGEVTYTVETYGGQPWLVRRQRRHVVGGIGGGSRADSAELVCPGVKRVVLEAPGSAARVDADGWRSLPATATVVVEFADPARPALRLVAHNR